MFGLFETALRLGLSMVTITVGVKAFPIRFPHSHNDPFRRTLSQSDLPVLLNDQATLVSGR